MCVTVAGNSNCETEEINMEFFFTSNPKHFTSYLYPLSITQVGNSCNYAVGFSTNEIPLVDFYASRLNFLMESQFAYTYDASSGSPRCTLDFNLDDYVVDFTQAEYYLYVFKLERY